jgi:hypothetical protein
MGLLEHSSLNGAYQFRIDRHMRYHLEGLRVPQRYLSLSLALSGVLGGLG